MKKLLSSLLQVAVVAAFSGIAAAQAVDRVTICHFPPGNPDNAQVITVGSPAVAAHVSQHGDAVCAEGDTDCCLGTDDAASVCTNLDTDVNNCGDCGAVCDLANATAACTEGTCVVATCDAGFGNCDGDATNGCETRLDTAANCGGCGRTCNSTETCVGGICTPVP